MHHPQFQVSGVAGAITGPAGSGLSIELVDQATGEEQDSVTVVVDDRLGILAPPAMGAAITVYMGYTETGLIFKGTFHVADVTLSGWPRQMSVHATGANMMSKVKEPVTQDFQMKPVSDIMGYLAGQIGVGTRVGGSVGSFIYKYIAMTEESPMNFITRLARKHNAIGKIANDTLIFVRRGEPLGAGAQATYPYNVKGYDLTLHSLEQFGSTVQDILPAGKDHEGKEDVEPKDMVGSATGSGGGPESMVPPEAPDMDEEATEDATSQQESLNQKSKILDITIIGDPNVFAGSTLTVTGVRPLVDGSWYILKVTHSMDGQSGYTTQIQCCLASEAGAAGGGGAGGGLTDLPAGGAPQP